MKPLLNHARHKRCKLRLLPAFLIRKLHMHEIQPLERMVFLDASVHVHATILTRMALDCAALVDDGQFALVGGDADVLNGDDAYHGEERARGLPAL